MFPIKKQSEETAQAAALNPIPVEEIGRSLQFDFDKRQFVMLNGRNAEVTKTEAVKQWLETMCRTLPNRYKIYASSGFGVETDKIIGYKALPVGFLYSEIQRQIKENAKMVRCIKSIVNFSAENRNGILNIYFTAVLFNGEEVDINAEITRTA